MKAILVLAAVFLLAACTPGVQIVQKSGKARVAVLSFAGDKLNVMEDMDPAREVWLNAVKAYKNAMNIAEPNINKQDFNISRERRWSHGIEDWGIGIAFEEALKKELSGKYQVVSFAYDRAAYAEDGDYYLARNDGAEDIADIIRAQDGFATAKDIAAYVVLLPGALQLSNYERASYGTGLYKGFYVDTIEPDSIFHHRYILHAFYYVAIFDGQTLEFEGGEKARNDDVFAWRTRNHPGKIVDSTYWPESFDAITPEQRKMIVAEIDVMIQQSMQTTLQELGLLP